jgi:hypothetical protein
MLVENFPDLRARLASIELTQALDQVAKYAWPCAPGTGNNQIANFWCAS